MEKVSIIIPVYNGERFLKQALCSIARQTYPELELILINDGSTDGSLELLKSFDKNKPEELEVRIVTKENGGICKARNTGLEYATGKYIMFMDQDDLLRHDCVETLINLLKDRHSDMLIGGYFLVDEKGRIIREYGLKPEAEWSKYRITAPWGRVFRKEIIDKNDIRFAETKISEDFYFNVVYMSNCRSISTTSYCGYAWRYLKTSESHSKMSVMSEERDPLKIMTQTLEEMKDDHFLDPGCLEYMMVKHIIWYLLYTAKGASKDQLRETYNRCFSWLQNSFPDWERHLKFNDPEGETLSVRSIIKVCSVLKRMKLLPFVLEVYSYLN